DVLAHLAQEVGRRPLAEREHLVRELLRHRAAELRLTHFATAGPAFRPDADVLRDGPVRLVPEHVVGAALERSVGPLLAERAIRRLVQAARRHPPPIVQDLARLRMERHPPALGLAAERPPEPPRAHLHLETDSVRRGDDLRHRAAVVREVVLRERVQDTLVATRCQILEIAACVSGDADGAVRAAGPAAYGRSAAASAVTDGSRRCDSSATSLYRSPR